MSAEKTPETYEVEEAYAYAVSVDCGEPRGECDHRAEFKRWLAARDAEVAAQALEEAADRAEGTDPVEHPFLGLDEMTEWLRAEAARLREGREQ